MTGIYPLDVPQTVLNVLNTNFRVTGECSNVFTAKFDTYIISQHIDSLQTQRRHTRHPSPKPTFKIPFPAHRGSNFGQSCTMCVQTSSCISSEDERKLSCFRDGNLSLVSIRSKGDQSKSLGRKVSSSVRYSTSVTHLMWSISFWRDGGRI